MKYEYNELIEFFEFKNYEFEIKALWDGEKIIEIKRKDGVKEEPIIHSGSVAECIGIAYLFAHNRMELL